MNNHDDDFIVCEVCEEIVRFSCYNEHLQECLEGRNHTDNSDTDEIDYDERDNLAIFERITRQNQLSTSANLRSFLETHFRSMTPRQRSPASSLPNVSSSIRHINQYEQNIAMAERIGRVEIGIHSIERVSTIITNPSDSSDMICPVCREQHAECSVIRKLTKCKHIFCHQCISRWLSNHKTCPVCMCEYK